MILQLLSNAILVVIKFVSSNRYEGELKPSKGSNQYDKESSLPDYDEDQDQLEEEQGEETGETSEATINEVF
jgi:hypothetical protein